MPHRAPSLAIGSICLVAVLAVHGLLITGGASGAPESASKPFELHLRKQIETSPKSGRFHQVTEAETWNPKETAIIVCDVWDLHHCLNAVRRETEFAPRLNQVVTDARKRGATIIHAPSSCMPFYEGHPARERAQQTPKSPKLPEEIGKWCYKIPEEERGTYPIDQTDGGEDDDLQEHAEWAAKLTAMGRNPKAPWKRQLDVITIDGDKDYISDIGEEVWSILEANQIKNVILAGVHTNMCVLGRPFGLRQMAKNGKHVVLLRDMTDTMYNPLRAPYVSHFTGTDLIVSHIEKFVCPTITSDQLIGGQTFRFSKDQRPHVVIVMSEQEYETNRTLPEFAAKYLGKDFRVSYVFGKDDDGNALPGLEVLSDANLLLLSVRRRALKPEQMAIIRKYVESGKSVIGIRTASHAFSLRGKPAPAGHVLWEELDAEVFGGHYSNHLGDKLDCVAEVSPPQKESLLVTGLSPKFAVAGSLYQVSPLQPDCQVLLTGTVKDHPSEPIAWYRLRKDGGRSFYTSLGHKDDFAKNADFHRLLVNAVYWATGTTQPKEIKIEVGAAK